MSASFWLNENNYPLKCGTLTINGYDQDGALIAPIITNSNVLCANLHAEYAEYCMTAVATANVANALKTATGIVTVSGATQPIAGMYLKASTSTTGCWDFVTDVDHALTADLATNATDATHAVWADYANVAAGNANVLVDAVGSGLLYHTGVSANVDGYYPLQVSSLLVSNLTAQTIEPNGNIDMGQNSILDTQMVQTDRLQVGNIIGFSPITIEDNTKILGNLDVTGTITGTIAGTVTQAQTSTWADSANALTTPLTAGEVTSANIAGSTYYTVQHMQDIFHSAGQTSGGTISANVSGNVDITAGTGLIRATDNSVAVLNWIDWSAQDDVTVPDNAVRYLGIEYNAGSPQFVAKSSYSWDLNTDFPLGSVVKEDGNVYINNAPHRVGDHAGLMIQRVYESMPYSRDRRTGGLIIGETGTRNVTVTAGAIWERLQRFPISAIDTSAANTFDIYYRDGVGGFTVQYAQTQFTNSQYDSGSGTLATLSANRYCNVWFYLNLNGTLLAQYGRGQYTSLSLANEETTPATAPKRIAVQGFLIGRIIVQQGQSSATAIQTVYETSFAGSQVADHGQLAGLADDDHTQYVLVDGSRSMTGALTVNPTTNQLVLGTTNTTTISSTAPSASRTYTITDQGASANFVLTTNTPTLNYVPVATGTATASWQSAAPAATKISTLTSTSGAIHYPTFVPSTANSNQQCYVDTGIGFIPSNGQIRCQIGFFSDSTLQLWLGAVGARITATAGAAVRDVTIPNIGTNSNFALSTNTTTTAGYVLTSDGTSGSAAWAAPAAPTITGGAITGTTTATAGGTTTLTSSSNIVQVFTGSSNQTIKLPATTALLGMTFVICNLSSGTLTIQATDASAVDSISVVGSGTYRAVATAGTNTDWMKTAS